MAPRTSSDHEMKNTEPRIESANKHQFSRYAPVFWTTSIANKIDGIRQLIETAGAKLL
jgi:hypothetical protein